MVIKPIPVTWGASSLAREMGWWINKGEHQRIDWCFQIVVLEKTLERPLDCKETKPVNPKGNQAWIFIGRTDADVKVPILWPPDGKSQLTGKDHDAGKDWGQEEKGMTEDEMVGWHHWLNGLQFEHTLGDSEGQGSLGAAVHGVAKSRTRLSDWTTANRAKGSDFEADALKSPKLHHLQAWFSLEKK